MLTAISLKTSREREREGKLGPEFFQENKKKSCNKPWRALQYGRGGGKKRKEREKCEQVSAEHLTEALASHQGELRPLASVAKIFFGVEGGQKIFTCQSHTLFSRRQTMVGRSLALAKRQTCRRPSKTTSKQSAEFAWY